MSISKSRRFTIFGILLFILVLLFIISGCSQLSKKESTTNDKFSALIPELNLRYEKLAKSIALAESIGGERDVTRDAKEHLKNYEKAKKDKNEKGQLKAARELENIIGRLRANVTGSPKLSASEELKSSFSELEDSLPSTSVTQPYKNSVKNFEEARTSWRLFLSAVIGGYGPPEQLEFSTPPTT